MAIWMEIRCDNRDKDVVECLSNEDIGPMEMAGNDANSINEIWNDLLNQALNNSWIKRGDYLVCPKCAKRTILCEICNGDANKFCESCNASGCEDFSTKEFTVRITHADDVIGEKAWNETFRKAVEDPETAAKEIIEKYNESIRPGEKQRRLISVQSPSKSA